MKKILWILLVIFVFALISICGCSKSNNPTSSGPAATSTPTPNATETAAALLTAGLTAQETATAVAANATATAVVVNATATQIAANATQVAANATATANASNMGTISGTLTLPNTSESGDTTAYMIIVSTDLYNFSTINNGGTNSYEGLVGSTTSIPYQLTATAGASYYVLAVTIPISGLGNGGPALGNFAGVYGNTFPAFPTSPNVTVTKNVTTSNVNITMGIISNSVSGTLTLPAASSSAGYAVWLSQTPPASMFVDGNGNLGNGPGQYSGTTSGTTTCTYTLPLILPGNYYIEAFVDVQGNGMITAGDYTGASSIIDFNPANNLTNQNFTLTTQQ